MVSTPLSFFFQDSSTLNGQNKWPKISLGWVKESLSYNWWFKNVYNEKEKHLFTVSWNSYGPIMSNKASWRQILYNLYFFLLFFYSGQWWLSDLKPNQQCLLNLGLYVAEGRTDYHSEWNTCLAYSHGAKSHSSRWCISFEEYINNWRQLKIHVNSQWGKSEVDHIYLLADSCLIRGGKLWYGRLIFSTQQPLIYSPNVAHGSWMLRKYLFS